MKYNLFKTMKAYNTLIIIVMTLFLISGVSAVDVYSDKSESQNYTKSNTNISLIYYNNTWLNFDGNGDYINISNHESLHPDNYNGLSVSAWIKVNDNTSTTRNFIVSRHNGATGGSYYLELYNPSTNDLRFVILNSSGTAITIKNLSVNLGDNNWHYIVGNAKPSEQLLQLYIDGVLYTNETFSNFDSIREYINPQPNMIGGFFNSGVPNLLFNGSIANVKIYNKTLTNYEINDTYHKGVSNRDDKFTIVVLPDVQEYYTNQDKLHDQIDWIINNKENLNIISVLHTGDLVATNNTVRWNFSRFELSRLYDEVSFGTSIGNHDYNEDADGNRNLSIMNNYFNNSLFENYLWYGGNYSNEPSNNYLLVSSLGDDYIIFNIEVFARNEVLNWVNNTVNNYSDRKVIINTHAFLRADNNNMITSSDSTSLEWYNNYFNRTNMTGNEPIDMWNNYLKKINNLFLIVNGHWASSDGVGYNLSLNDAGNPVHILLSNFQHYDNGGNGYLRYYTFYKNNDFIDVNTYSPSLNVFNLTNEFDFYINYNFSNNIIVDLQFDENSGKIVYDSSKNKNNGTITGSTWLNDGIQITTILNPVLTLINDWLLEPIYILYNNYKKDLNIITPNINYILLNNTDSSNSFDYKIYNITSGSLVYNSNGSVPSSCRNLDCTQVNITLQPNNYTYVLNNFNVTEEVTREHSPISITSTSTTTIKKTIHINSSLVDTVNITVKLNADCDKLGSVTYTSNSGLYTLYYIPSTTFNQWFYQGETFTCTDGTVTLNNVPIEYATNSNEFELNYNAQALNSCNESINYFISYMALIGLIGAIIFLGLMISYLIGIVDKSQFNKYSIVNLISTLILISILLIVSVVIISTVCTVF